MVKKKYRSKTEEGSRRHTGSEQLETKSATKNTPPDRNHTNHVIHTNGHVTKNWQNSDQNSCTSTEDIVEMKNIKTKTENKDSATENLFPQRFHWILFAVTLTFRIWYVSRPSNWWVLHPDEIYQTMEVAHTEVYGYGFRPYEYLPPPGFPTINVTSELRTEEVNRGMYSLRSFLLPKLLAAVLYTAACFIPNVSPYLVIRIFHVIVTSTLPVTVYGFSLALYQSHDVATLAAIFVSSSTTLNVFGTHTLNNSFISPVLFYTLVPLIKILTRSRTKTGQKSNHKKTSNINAQNSAGLYETTKNPKVFKSDVANTNGDQKSLHQNGCNKHNHRLHNNGSVSCNNLFEEIQHGDVNGNIHHRIRQNKTNSPLHPGTRYMNGGMGGHIEQINGVYLHSRHKKVHNFVKCRTEEVWRKFVQTILPVSAEDLWNSILGLFCALCIYIRLDSVILPTLCIIVLHPAFLFNLPHLLCELRAYIFGFVAGVLIGGADDHVMYGKWFISPIQWFKFNVWHDWSGEMFGISPTSYYLDRLLEMEPFVLIVIAVLVLYVLLYLRSPKLLEEFQHQSSTLLISVLILTVYSSSRHKEYRFIQNAVILMYVSISSIYLCFSNFILRLLLNQNGFFRNVYTYLIILTFVSSHMYTFLCVRDADLSRWSYGGHIRSEETNACLDFLRQRDDVTGVYVDFDFYMFGGYSILNKNVSIMALNNFNVNEYSLEDRVYIKQPLFDKDSKPKSLALFWRISEFISLLNTPYLLKHLIRHREYNYIIKPSDREFIDIGYRKVFSFGKTVVLQRTFNDEDEQKLWKKADTIPVGTNATVMEYEGYWLQLFGHYSTAETRLIISNRLDPYRIGPFQLLRKMFTKMNDTVNVKNVMKACLQIHSRKQCYGTYVPINLALNLT